MTNDTTYGNFTDFDKFPADCETFDCLQSNIRHFAAVAQVAGADILILTGCQTYTDEETNVEYRRDGYVFVKGQNDLAGEILHHPAQVAQTHFAIQSDPITVFANGEQFANAYSKRWAKESADTGYEWATVIRASDISNTVLKSALNTLLQRIQTEETTRAAAITALTTAVNGISQVPMGTICLWTDIKGDGRIPTGWTVCDGRSVQFSDGVTRQTPNFMGRFPVGAGTLDGTSYVLKSPGGAKEQSITLTVANMPKHKHSGNTDYAGNHRHSFEDAYYAENRSGQSGTYFGSDEGYDQDNALFTRAAYTEYAPTHKHKFNTDEVGGGQSFTVPTIPPYIAVRFIIKL